MTDTLPAVTPEMKKYNSSVGVKKVKAVYKKRARHDKKQVTRKQNIRDIIPINKTKKLKTTCQQYGGVVYSSKTSGPSNKSNRTIKPSNVKKVEDKKKEVITTAVPPELVIQKNTNIDFLSMAKAKKREFKFMIFKKNSPEGQMTYLEAIYYQLMGYWQNVYKHLEPKQKFFKNLYQILESSADAFQLHTSTGIQIVDNTTLSSGTNMDNYCNIVYCLSMMRRNARDNFLSSCDKEVINYIGGLFKTAGTGITAGIRSVLKLTKALVKVSSIFGMRGGFDDMKKLYTELFNGNSLLKPNLKYAAKHKGKAGLICALFRYRRDQLVYNYYLDKFLVRMKLLFKTQADQINFLNGNHPFLYGKNGIEQAKKYSINAITTTTATTFLTRFKFETETNTKLEDIKKELRAKLGSLASKLEMGNVHELYTVLDNNEQIYYKYTNQNGKNVKVLKPVFNMTQGTDKKQTLNYDAAGLAHTYRIYHMLNHLYPNSSLLMETQAKLLTLYGLPRFDELSYHKKKFKNIRESKNFAADFERFSASINNISGTIDGYVNKLLSSIDYAVSAGTTEMPDEDIQAKEHLRGIITFLQGERQKVYLMQEPELYTYRDKFIRQMKQLFGEFTSNQAVDENEEGSNGGNEEASESSYEGNTLTSANEYNLDNSQPKEPEDILNAFDIPETVINGIYSNKQPQRSTFIELINILISWVRENLSKLVGNSVRVKYDRDALPKLYSALGIKTPVDTSLLRGGGAAASSPYDLDNWDGTDAYLDAHLAYKQAGGADTQIGGAGEDDYIMQKINADADGPTVNYLQLKESGLRRLYKIIIDFLNSPHFINSGSKIDKVIYKLVPSGLGLDTGKGRDIGKESIFMELNYFNYLIKFEMGVLIFDDEQPNSELPLGTNLNRMVSGLPLFYETYLVNYFTDINSGGQTNYSCIGYQLADKKINGLLKNNGQTFIHDYRQEKDTGTGTEMSNDSLTKGRILRETFGDASKVNETGSRRKIPLSLLELTTMTPEELLSLMSLSSNVIMEKLISDKQASALNENLRSGAHLKPLVKFINELYGNSYHIGNNLTGLDEDTKHEYPTLLNPDTNKQQANIAHLRAITKFIKNEIQASKFWNRNTHGIRDALWNTNDSSITNIIKLILKVTGSVISGMLLVKTGLFVIPLACVVPWVATHLLYKHESYNTIYDEFTAYIDNPETAPEELHNFWKNLNQEEKDYIKAEGERLFKVNRELKYNYFYTSPIRDESGYTGTAITAETILNNLNLLGFIDGVEDIDKQRHRRFLGIPIQGTKRTKYQASIIECVKEISTTIQTDNQKANLYLYAANLLIGRLNDKHNKVLTDLVKNKEAQPEKYDAFKNIFTDQGQDNYGLKIFEMLERQLVTPATPTPAPAPTHRPAHRQSNASSEAGTEEDIEARTEEWETRSTASNRSNMSGGGSQSPITHPVAAYKASTKTRVDKEKAEILNVILGLNRYIDSIDMFTKAQDAVDESIVRLQNTVARVVSGNKVKTVDDKLIKSGASEFKTQLLKGAFNGLYTTNMRLISESGVINLIQYYRNVLLDISNSERELIASTFERDESRIKYNKVLSKILVFLRLNLLFTDYVLQNSKLLSGNAGSPGDKFEGEGLADVIGDLLVRGGEPDSTEEESKLLAPMRIEHKEVIRNVAGWAESVRKANPEREITEGESTDAKKERLALELARAAEKARLKPDARALPAAPPAPAALVAPAPSAIKTNDTTDIKLDAKETAHYTKLVQLLIGTTNIKLGIDKITISFVLGDNFSGYEKDTKMVDEATKYKQNNPTVNKNGILFFDVNYLSVIRELYKKHKADLEEIRSTQTDVQVIAETDLNEIYECLFKIIGKVYAYNQSKGKNNPKHEPDSAFSILHVMLLKKLGINELSDPRGGKQILFPVGSITKFYKQMNSSTEFYNDYKVIFVLLMMLNNYFYYYLTEKGYSKCKTDANLCYFLKDSDMANIYKISTGPFDNKLIPIGVDKAIYKLITTMTLESDEYVFNTGYDTYNLNMGHLVKPMHGGGIHNLKAMKTKKRNNTKSR